MLAIMRQNGCVQLSDSEELMLRAVEVQVLLARIGDVKKPGGGDQVGLGGGNGTKESEKKGGGEGGGTDRVVRR